MPMLIVALFRTAKIWNQARCPSTYSWIKENMTCIHIYYRLLFSHKEAKQLEMRDIMLEQI
jgi:hypothetical protein